ncbi:MAG: hypothetical protein K2Q22_17935, partial [Cytophagales bacterium]|nr:hypothetical protein [Cytophagales bacterium]
VTGTLEQLKEKKIFDNHWFRTSMYETFKKKWDAIDISPGWNWSVMTGVDQIGVNVAMDELFDGYETVGLGNQMPLIVWKADESNYWMKMKIKPLMYNDYPFNINAKIDWRDSTFGIPPIYAVKVSQDNEPRYLTDDDKSGASNNAGKYVSIDYNLVEVGYYDYKNLQSKAAYLSYLDIGKLNYLLVTPYSNILRGKYRVNSVYLLPGLNRSTSDFGFDINNR